MAAALALPGCANISGDDEATAPFGVEVSAMYITVENRAGTALVDGKVEILPAGRAVVFTTSWPRMESGDRRDFMLNVFRGSDGTPFRRGVIRARQVKVTAKDLYGKVYERLVPFE
ncbi:MAG: hypothetical protein ACRD26_01600 [Vicinamibacterales bacterium]